MTFQSKPLDVYDTIGQDCGKEQMDTRKDIQNSTKKNQTLWEFIKFTLMSGMTTLVDLSVFAQLNRWIFTGYKNIGASWWIFNYYVENVGLCALLSLVVSSAVSQTVNFFIQRKITFGATNIGIGIDKPGDKSLWYTPHRTNTMWGEMAA